ncbi:MAG TPA: acyl-ACP thioesterase domain-containing protein [Sphingobacterium sp.]|nr:acyl-ACP thioesterase domain-containing protein [Sphingobacterium sp.]
MQPTIYSNSYTINFTQCYSNGYLRYSELSNLLQLTASDHATLLGFGYMEMSKSYQSWVLSRVRIEIDRLPRFLEQITVRTWVQDFLGNRSVRNFEILQNGEKIAGATTFWAVFNVRSRKSEDLKAAVDPVIIQTGRTATNEPFKRIEAKTLCEQTVHYTPKLSDLDIVNHVNNVKYTDWCLDTLDPETVLKRHFKTVDINYIKELKLGESVTINHSIDGNKIDFSIKRGDKAVFLMQLTN